MGKLALWWFVLEEIKTWLFKNKIITISFWSVEGTNHFVRVKQYTSDLQLFYVHLQLYWQFRMQKKETKINIELKKKKLAITIVVIDFSILYIFVLIQLKSALIED